MTGPDRRLEVSLDDDVSALLEQVRTAQALVGQGQQVGATAWHVMASARANPFQRGGLR